MKRYMSIVIVCLFVLAGTISSPAQIVYELVERIDVEPVWSGHPVGFALITVENIQFVAYYDAERNMVVAQRKLDEKQWTFKRLPTSVGWNSHNDITMTVDRDGYLHVTGNMHTTPLIYFRSEKPLDVESLVQVAEMVGENETRVTYPVFMFGADNELFFTYRYGRSGDGIQIWNVYDADTKTWSRLFDMPFFDGQGRMNAYPHPLMPGPDGFYHITWIWRYTPDCETNHNISYGRTRDLRTWENSRGEVYILPITLETSDIVDPVPPLGGLLNPLQRIGFDLAGRVIVSYTKYDADGNFQVYNARLEDGEWKHYQTSDWNYRWEFSGRGTIVGEVTMGAVVIENGQLVQTFNHIREGSGRWLLDPETLKPIGRAPAQVRFPREIGLNELDFPTVQNRSTWDIADRHRPHEGGQVRYMMRWETQPANRDRPHPTTPPPSMLRVFKLQSQP